MKEGDGGKAGRAMQEEEDGEEKRVARAPGRVCVRLINQTLAFGEREGRGVGNCRRRMRRRRKR